MILILAVVEEQNIKIHVSSTIVIMLVNVEQISPILEKRFNWMLVEVTHLETGHWGFPRVIQFRSVLSHYVTDSTLQIPRHVNLFS